MGKQKTHTRHFRVSENYKIEVFAVKIGDNDYSLMVKVIDE